jgi:hypothetical protein
MAKQPPQSPLLSRSTSSAQPAASFAAVADRSEQKDWVHPDGWSRFEELRRRETDHMLYAFDLIEHDATTTAIGHFSTLKRRWRNCSALPWAGIVLTAHVAEDGPTVFAQACRLGAEGMVSKKDRARVWSGGPQPRKRRGAAAARRRTAQMIAELGRHVYCLAPQGDKLAGAALLTQVPTASCRVCAVLSFGWPRETFWRLPEQGCL